MTDNNSSKSAGLVWALRYACGAGSSSGISSRSDITFDEAVDVMWACSSPELYDLLVLQRGWTGERFGRFIAGTMAAALLANEK